MHELNPIGRATIGRRLSGWNHPRVMHSGIRNKDLNESRGTVPSKVAAWEKLEELNNLQQPWNTIDPSGKHSLFVSALA